jgi:polyphenol oxidase
MSSKEFLYRSRKSGGQDTYTFQCNKHHRMDWGYTKRGAFLKPDHDRQVDAQQIHSNRVVLVDELLSDRSLQCKGADGFMTLTKKVRLKVYSADCLSIFFMVPRVKPVIGLIHAGWRGTYKGIASRTVRQLLKKGNVSSKSVYVFIGPALRFCCYQVGSEFVDRFPHSTFHKSQTNQYYFDLVGENRRQLLKAGIEPSHIADCGICTGCQEENFYSFRREGEAAGRICSWIRMA